MLGIRLAVGQRTLDPYGKVRILHPQPLKTHIEPTSYPLRLIRMNVSQYKLVSPQAVIEQYQQRLDNLDKNIRTYLGYIHKEKANQMQQLSSRLVDLNPLAILARGYSVTYLEGLNKPLKGIIGVKPGDILKTKLNKGVIISQVKECEK